MSKIPRIKVKVENFDSIIFARDTNIQFQYVYDSYFKQESDKKIEKGNCCVNNNLHQQMKLKKTNFPLLTVSPHRSLELCIHIPNAEEN